MSVASWYGCLSERSLRHVRFLGSGRFGSVDEYALPDEHPSPLARVAVKVVNGSARDGAELGSVKELAALSELAGAPFVIRLVEVIPQPGGQLALAMERCVSDLQAVVQAGSFILSEADVKSYARMLLTGLAAVHERGFMHRDLKPENVLVAAKGEVRIADFGHAARIPAERQTLGHLFATVWYRAPELLLRAPTHGPAVDVWSAGCIMAELYTRRPIFPGVPSDSMTVEDNTLGHIYRLRGTPTAESWPGWTSLPGWRDVEARTPQRMSDILAGTSASTAAADLLEGLLEANPQKRLTAREALSHPFFAVEPAPTPPGRLPVPKSAMAAAASVLIAERTKATAKKGP